jgi:hypothetical protein
LISHPYLTLREIRGEKDYSQSFFIVGFPLYLWLPVAFVFLVFELVNFFLLEISWPYHRFILAFFAMITLLLLALEAYIAYWVFIYWRLKKKYEKS